MKVYIDDDFRCHTTNPDGIFREVETELLDGKCQTFIEGCRFVPEKESWTRADGKVFDGEAIALFKPCEQLEAAQAQYEADLAEIASAYQEGVDSVWT